VRIFLYPSRHAPYLRYFKEPIRPVAGLSRPFGRRRNDDYHGGEFRPQAKHPSLLDKAKRSGSHAEFVRQRNESNQPCAEGLQDMSSPLDVRERCTRPERARLPIASLRLLTCLCYNESS